MEFESPGRRRLIALIVACALFMENLDSTVIATALPSIAASLGENPLHLNLAITSYLISLAIFIPISGWFADRFGTRLVFRLAIGVFMLGSILCGLSGSLAEFVGARVLQGMGGAMMVPVGRLILVRSVPKRELVNAMAFVTIPALIGPIMGPPLGGFITTYFSWHWIFWINVPIGILGLVLATLFISPVREPSPPPLDLRGFLLTSIGLGGVVFGFEAIGRDILPDAVVAALLTVGAGCIVLYLLHARRVRHPVLALGLFRIATFRIAVAGGFLFRVGIGSIPFLLPLMLQLGFGMNALNSGLLTFFAAVGALAMKTTAAVLVKRIGFRRILIVNGILGALFLGAHGLFQADTPWAVLVAVLLMGGFFRSLQFTSINALTYADVPRDLMSRATSLASMTQQLSLSVGVGIGAAVLHIVLSMRGGTTLMAGDFMYAFFATALIALSSVLVFWRLGPDAGGEVSGRKPPPPAAPAVTATQGP